MLWTFWTLFYAVVMYFQIPEISAIGALISSMAYHYVYALLSVLIWFLCKKIRFDRMNKLLFIFLHFILANFFSALWLFIVYGSWFLAQGESIFEVVNFKNIVGWQFLSGMTVYFLIAGIFYTIIYYRNFKQKQLAEAELKTLTREAELKALKMQMNPHFLFNSLNSINALVTKDPKLARKMISQLSVLLRVSLETSDKLMIPLQEELRLVHTYLSIEQIRFKDKMVFKEKIDPELLPVPFPAMLLQPLIENAVKYGIASSRRGGAIDLIIEKTGNQIVGTISNSVAETRSSVFSKNGKNGLSLNNIRQRLDRMYGKNYFWEIDRSQKNLFKIIFKLPLASEK